MKQQIPQYAWMLYKDGELSSIKVPFNGHLIHLPLILCSRSAARIVRGTMPDPTSYTIKKVDNRFRPIPEEAV
jgi:hypothetical protein